MNTTTHEKLLPRKHLQKFCSINNTALFDKSVNKTNTSDQNFHYLASFPNNLFAFFQAESYKIYIFSIAVV